MFNKNDTEDILNAWGIIGLLKLLLALCVLLVFLPLGLFHILDEGHQTLSIEELPNKNFGFETRNLTVNGKLLVDKIIIEYKTPKDNSDTNSTVYYIPIVSNNWSKENPIDACVSLSFSSIFDIKKHEKFKNLLNNYNSNKPTIIKGVAKNFLFESYIDGISEEVEKDFKKIGITLSDDFVLIKHGYHQDLGGLIFGLIFITVISIFFLRKLIKYRRYKIGAFKYVKRNVPPSHLQNKLIKANKVTKSYLPNHYKNYDLNVFELDADVKEIVISQHYEDGEYYNSYEIWAVDKYGDKIQLFNGAIHGYEAQYENYNANKRFNEIENPKSIRLNNCFDGLKILILFHYSIEAYENGIEGGKSDNYNDYFNYIDVYKLCGKDLELLYEYQCS